LMERPSNINVIAAALSHPNHGAERRESLLSIFEVMSSSQGPAMLAEV
jgi:hypothetical protein